MRASASLILLLLLFSGAFAQQPAGLTWKPLKPVVNDKLVIQYDARKSELKTNSPVTATAYIFTKGEPSVHQLTPSSKDGVYSFTVPVGEDDEVIALAFHADEKTDINGKAGYLIPVHKDGKPVKGAGLSTAQIYSGYGNYLFGLEAQPEIALEYAKKEYETYPEDRSLSTANYFNLLRRVHGKESEEMILSEIAKREKSEKLSENELTTFAGYYNQFKQKEKADQLKAERNKKFPDGEWVLNEKIDAIYTTQDPAEKEKLLTDFIDFAKDRKNAEPRLTGMKTMLAGIYAKAGKWSEMNNLAKDLPIEQKAGLYNNIAWESAEKDQDIDQALKLSEEATLWAKKEVDAPTTKKPAIRTDELWLQDRQSTYSMYADTYAFILYKKGEYAKAFPYARDAAKLRKMEDGEYNDRYALLLEKVSTPAEVKKEIEPLVEAGSAGAESKAVLKRAYTAVNKSEEGYDQYYAKLSAKAIAAKKAELEKKMINEPAPVFKLVNLSGESVDMASLKGKVVVLDFWATWCGPCIASFPGMQKAVNKYKDDPNVAFLFIDTWESTDDREKLVTDFIKKNNYSFNVLYDKQKEDNPDAFVVVSDYKVSGIPTKFVVDKQGNIRFKSVGYGGGEDGLVDELTLMIELAGK